LKMEALCFSEKQKIVWYCNKKQNLEHVKVGTTKLRIIQLETLGS